jgi:hypothetical protein
MDIARGRFMPVQIHASSDDCPPWCEPFSEINKDKNASDSRERQNCQGKSGDAVFANPGSHLSMPGAGSVKGRSRMVSSARPTSRVSMDK